VPRDTAYGAKKSAMRCETGWALIKTTVADPTCSLRRHYPDQVQRDSLSRSQPFVTVSRQLGHPDKMGESLRIVGSLGNAPTAPLAQHLQQREHHQPRDGAARDQRIQLQQLSAGALLEQRAIDVRGRAVQRLAGIDREQIGHWRKTR